MGRNAFVLITLLFVYFCQFFCSHAVTFWNNGCSDINGNFTKGSVYERNLDRLLSNLSSKASSSKFHNSTTGNFPNKIYGLYQCGEDYTIEICRVCIRDATQKIKKVCPLYGEGIVWYYECMLRYANRSIFSLYETSPSSAAWYQDSIANYDKFSPVLTSTMNTTIGKAARTTARGHFASTTVYWTSIDRVYCFAQCTPDIDDLDCMDCLKLTMGEIYSNYNASKGVSVFYPSCQIGYDTELPLIPAPSASGETFCISQLKHRSSSFNNWFYVIVYLVQFDPSKLVTWYQCFKWHIIRNLILILC